MRLQDLLPVAILLVVGIVALLIAVILPPLQLARRKAIQTKCGAQLQQLGRALESARNEHGFYPLWDDGGTSIRYTWIDVRNGSIWNPDEDDEGELEGSNATHQVHRFRLRVNVPITRNFSLGAEGIVFYRDSEYSLEELEDVTQRNPEVRLYVTWDLGYTRRRAQRAAAAGRN